MNINEIIKDALKYPLSDWKKILILGIIIVISGISGLVSSLGITNNILVIISVFIGVIAGFLSNGYLFKILKTSLNGKNILPEFKAWSNILIDGIKVFIIFLIYIILPPLFVFFILLLFSGALSSSGLNLSEIIGSLVVDPLNFILTGILPGIEILFTISYTILNQFVIILLFEFILILPLFLVGIANMAYEGEFKDAFRLGEIIDIIKDIGWVNLIKWYITTGLIFLIFIILGIIVSIFLSFNGSINIVSILLALILLPYSQMYYIRALALYYKPE
jgi:hypothetical protein